MHRSFLAWYVLDEVNSGDDIAMKVCNFFGVKASKIVSKPVGLPCMGVGTKCHTWGVEMILE